MVGRLAAALLLSTSLVQATPAQSNLPMSKPGEASIPGRRYDYDNPYCRSLFGGRYEGASDQGDAVFYSQVWWLRNYVGKLGRSSDGLVRARAQTTPDVGAVRSHAAKIAKVSHRTLKLIGGSGLAQTSAPVVAAPRPLTTTLEDVAAIDSLVDQLAAAVRPASSVSDELARSRRLTVERLQRVEALARQVEADLRRK